MSCLFRPPRHWWNPARRQWWLRCLFDAPLIPAACRLMNLALAGPGITPGARPAGREQVPGVERQVRVRRSSSPAATDSLHSQAGRFRHFTPRCRGCSPIPLEVEVTLSSTRTRRPDPPPRLKGRCARLHLVCSSRPAGKERVQDPRVVSSRADIGRQLVTVTMPRRHRPVES